MALSNLLTGRVRVISPKNVTQDRYQFIDLSQVEPNLGVPNFSASLSGSPAIVVSDDQGNRGFVRSLDLDRVSGQFTGSFTGSAESLSGSFTGSFSGSFIGDGAGLINLPDTIRLASGSATASISPNRGLQIGTRTFVSGNLSVTGGLFITGGNVVVSSGSTYIGDGSGLTNINIANLSFETSLLQSGSAIARISPDFGFVVNTSASISGDLTVSHDILAVDITASHAVFAPIVSGGLIGTYTFKGVGPTASAEYDILRYNDTQGYYIPQPETSLTETVSFSNVSDLTIVHNLGIVYPMVQVYATGSEDQIIPGTVKSIDEDTIQIKFAGLTSGHVVIGSGGSLINGTITGDRVFGTVLSASFANKAALADAVTGFDSASLSALSASLSNANAYVLASQTSSMAVFSAVSSSYALTASFALNGGGGGTELFIYHTGSLVKAQTAKINFSGSGVNVISSGSDGVLVTINGGAAQSSQTASYILSTGVDGPLGMDSITFAVNSLTASFALNSANTDTSSFLNINTNQTINASLTISGSLGVSGSVI